MSAFVDRSSRERGEVGERFVYADRGVITVEGEGTRAIDRRVEKTRRVARGRRQARRCPAGRGDRGGASLATSATSRCVMKSGLSRSIILAALPIVAVAALGCVGDTADPTVAEVLVEPAAAAPDTAAARVDQVPTWAREDGLSEADLRALLADLGERAALRDPNGEAWQAEPGDAAH